jgi:glutamate transport system permease protein
MQVLIDNLPEIIDGFQKTLWLLFFSGAIALVLGTLLAAMRVSPVTVMRGAGTSYVNVFRNTPLLLILFIFTYALPPIGFTYDVSDYFNFQFVAAMTGMGLYTAAFVCEAIRSGVNSIPVGQAEAARALGMTFTQSMGSVILPQAFRAVIPPLANTYISLAKNTSVALAIGVTEASFALVKLRNDNVSDQWWIFGGVAAGYVLIVLAISAIAAVAERMWRVAR